MSSALSAPCCGQLQLGARQDCASESSRLRLHWCCIQDANRRKKEMTSVIASDPRRWRDVLRKELIPAELRHLVKVTAQTAALEAGVESVTHG